MAANLRKDIGDRLRRARRAGEPIGKLAQVTVGDVVAADRAITSK